MLWQSHLREVTGKAKLLGRRAQRKGEHKGQVFSLAMSHHHYTWVVLLAPTPDSRAQLNTGLTGMVKQSRFHEEKQGVRQRMVSWVGKRAPGKESARLGRPIPDSVCLTDRGQEQPLQVH